MTFMQTLLDGNKGAFYAVARLTPMQKLTLRFVVIGLVYYAFAAIEGMIMRIYAVEPISLIPPDQYFGILTAHPLVGIFGSTYLLVVRGLPVPGAVPDEASRCGATGWRSSTFWLIAIGTFVFWFDGFLTHYAPLYTLYWPLPADTSASSSPGAGSIFVAGIALIMLGTLAFVWNIFATILYTPKGEAVPAQVAALPVGHRPDRLHATSSGATTRTRDLVPLPRGRGRRVAPWTRAFNADRHPQSPACSSSSSWLAAAAGHLARVDTSSTPCSTRTGSGGASTSSPTAWCSSGWPAPGTCWPRLITGKPVFMPERRTRGPARRARRVAGRSGRTTCSPTRASQPCLKIVSGELVTAFELITQGLAFFITLATLWIGAAAEDDQRAQVPAGRPDRLRAGRGGGHPPGGRRPQPHPPQHPVGHRPARPRGRARGPHDDPLLGRLPAAADPHQRRPALEPQARQRPLLGPAARWHRHGRLHGHGRPAGHAATDHLLRTASSRAS